MGTRAAGRWLNIVVSADATIVLSGAVLTAYVGVSGLIRRMAMDRCLPQFLLHTNALRGTVHWIIIGFFVVTSSLCMWAADTYTRQHTHTHTTHTKHTTEDAENESHSSQSSLSRATQTRSTVCTPLPSSV